MSLTDNDGWPGQRFGAAADGPGSVASMGRRALAFLLDIFLAAAIGYVITYPAAPENLALLIWAGMTIFTVAIFGITPGHAALGLRVASVQGAIFVGAWAIPRTALIFVVIPALIVDADGRGLHDRWTRTIVLRSR